MTGSIPFNRPYVSGKELHFIAQVLSAADCLDRQSFGVACERFMEDRFGAHRVLLTTSCTSALEMAAMLLDLEPGDEVIMPSYTFVSTANAFHLRGARLRFVDIRPDTLNLDEEQIEAAITEKTRAIVPVHYAGVSCEMDEILAISKRHGLRVIEDAAQGVDATYKGRYEGTIGDMGTYSFHDTKNFACGEGGALVVQDPELARRALALRGDNRAGTQLVLSDVLSEADSPFVLPEALAAYLYAQLSAIEEITSKRQRVYERYMERLAPLAERGLVVLPTVPSHCQINYHLFHILLPDLAQRTALSEHLRDQGIQAVFHYIPLHDSPVGHTLGYQKGMLPITEDRADRLLRLPFFCDLDDDAVDRVVGGIFEFFQVRSPR